MGRDHGMNEARDLVWNTPDLNLGKSLPKYFPPK